MSKESWYASKLNDIDVVRISESDDWIVDYNKKRGMYRVSYFQDNHFKNEYWFDAYEDKEIDDKIKKIINLLESFKYDIKKENANFSNNAMIYFLDKLIERIKNLK